MRILYNFFWNIGGVFLGSIGNMGRYFINSDSSDCYEFFVSSYE